MFFSTMYSSPVGEITLASDGSALCGLWLGGQKYFGQSIPGKMTKDDSVKPFAQVKKWLDAYFAGKNTSVNKIPLAPIGSDFRQAVWKKLLEIPYGETTTYGAIACALKSEGIKCAPIAVGGAVGHNPISIIIPCHRVVGSNGKLTGYAGGLDRKQQLLELEGVI